MLKFVNENGILFTGIISVITALIAAFATHIVEGKREKKESIKVLQEEVARLKSDLKRFEDQEAADRAVDKSDGSLYVESLPNGKSRVICGFCWEENHFKTPIVPEWYYGHQEQYEVCKCPICERYCRGKDVYVDKHPSFSILEADDLPF